MSIEEDRARYERAMHAMQSGVAARMGYDHGETTPKHLRVGVNSALLQNSALALLLMRTGVIAEADYWKALADAAEEEKGLYERWLSNHTGATVHLG